VPDIVTIFLLNGSTIYCDIWGTTGIPEGFCTGEQPTGTLPVANGGITSGRL